VPVMVGKIPVVILAGGNTPDNIIESGESEKERAFIDVCGRPMLGWVLDAVRTSGSIGEILVIGNSKRMKDVFGFADNEIAEQKSSMLENLMIGMNAFRDQKRVLVVTCDIPLITTGILDDLIGQIYQIEADIHYPIVDVAYFDERFPGSHRTTQKLKEGTFTGGNIFQLSPGPVIANRERVEAVIRDRKSPAKLVKLFGMGFILKFALRQLDLKGLESKASQILGAKMRAVLTKHPQVGLDVDKSDDLKLVREVLGRA